MINTRYSVPFLPVSGSVLDGSTTKVKYADLQDLAGSVSVGLYDAETYAIATGSGNGKRFFIGHSSEHTRDFIDKFLFGAQLPRGASFWEFRGEDVISFEFSAPQKKRGEKWTLGFDGSIGCNASTPKFECGKVYGVDIDVSGSPTFRRWAKVLEHQIFTDPICCNDDACATGCQDGFVDGLRVVKELAEKINNHVELSQAGVKARYISSDFAATTPNMNKYQITIQDDGSGVGMAFVKQSAGPDANIVRISRVGCTSVYEVCAATSPTTVQQPANIALPSDCAVCPAGSTTVAARNIFIVTRPLAGTEDLTTDAARQTFANTVLASYPAGTGKTAVFLSQNGATATVELRYPTTTTTLTAILADSVTFARTTGITCTLTAPAAIAWVLTGTAYRMTRTLCLTLPRKDCALGTNRLAELQAAYATNPMVVASSLIVVAGTQTCADTYNVQQYSKGCMEDACLAYDTAFFEDFGSFENTLWEVVEPTPPVYDATKKYGLEITATLPEQFISDCEFQLGDHFEVEPIRLEVQWINDSFTGFPSNCDMKSLKKAKRSQTGRIDTQTGEWVLREYIKAGAYDIFGDDSSDVKTRRVMDEQRRKQVDRAAQYSIYYLQFKVHRQGNFDKEAEFVEATFAFPVGDPKIAKFEAAILGPLSKFGVTLKERK